jgi:predicted nucleic acid-binding protein
VPQLLWDASGLIKKYYKEVGSETVIALFEHTPALPMASTFLGYAETSAILRRKLNQSFLTAAQFNNARLLLRQEVLTNPGFDLWTVDDVAILNGIALNDRHNLNASDAAILVTFLRYARSRTPGLPACVLVASDQRFLRTANAEGLQTLNPESVSAADLSALLASLI